METTPPTGEDREKSKSASSEKAARIKRLADSIGKNSHDDTKEYALDKADLSDIPAILDRLLSEAGPSGLSSETPEAMDKMLERWAKDDFESALHWAKTHPILFLFFRAIFSNYGQKLTRVQRLILHHTRRSRV